MATNHDSASEAVNYAFAFFVDDLLPTEADRDWAETKMRELGEAPFDVLYGQREDGSHVMDPDYVPGFLLSIQAGVRLHNRLELKQALIAKMVQGYLPMPCSVVDMLDGKMGEAEQRAFLHGAMKMVEVMMEAVLLQRELARPDTES